MGLICDGLLWCEICVRVPLWRIIDRDCGRGFFACKGLLGTRAVLSVVLWGSYRKDKCGGGWL